MWVRYSIFSYPLYNTWGCVSSVYLFPCDDWENIYTLSYYHHQIESMNYYPSFRVRSWNNGVHCMSSCILRDCFFLKWQTKFVLFATVEVTRIVYEMFNDLRYTESLLFELTTLIYIYCKYNNFWSSILGHQYIIYQKGKFWNTFFIFLVPRIHVRRLDVGFMSLVQ